MVKFICLSWLSSGETLEPKSSHERGEGSMIRETSSNSTSALVQARRWDQFLLETTTAGSPHARAWLCLRMCSRPAPARATHHSSSSRLWQTREINGSPTHRAPPPTTLYSVPSTVRGCCAALPCPGFSGAKYHTRRTHTTSRLSLLQRASGIL